MKEMAATRYSFDIEEYVSRIAWSPNTIRAEAIKWMKEKNVRSVDISTNKLLYGSWAYPGLIENEDYGRVIRKGKYFYWVAARGKTLVPIYANGKLKSTKTRPAPFGL